MAIFVLASAGARPTVAGAQTPGLTGGLEPGRHAVGFTVVEALDSTRAIRPLRDYRGRMADETARPVQVSVWYPARSSATATRMRAGEFRLLTRSELDFGVTLDARARRLLRAEFIESATGLGTDSARAAGLWDDPTLAVRDAPPLDGAHPTLLFFTSLGVGNPELADYLASHGFVVASFPSNGRMTESSLEFTPNALTLDTDIGDAGFVYQVLRRLPFADAERLALGAFSGGSLAALLWQMRDMQAAAVVTLEGWERYRRGADIMSGSVHFEPHRLGVPFLMIERGPDEASPQFGKVPDVVGALPYAEITRVAFRDAAHVDFLSHSRFGHTEQQPRIYAASARMVRNFLEYTLRGDDAAGAMLAELHAPVADPFFTVTRDPAAGRVPTEEELYRLAETDLSSFRAAYDAGAAIVNGRELFREAVLTRAARFADSAGARAEIMRVVVNAYPESTAARFGLAEALAQSNRADEADAAYRAALELVDTDPTLDDDTRARWRQRIGDALGEAPPLATAVVRIDDLVSGANEFYPIRAARFTFGPTRSSPHDPDGRKPAAPTATARGPAPPDAAPTAPRTGRT